MKSTIDFVKYLLKSKIVLLKSKAVILSLSILIIFPFDSFNTLSFSLFTKLPFLAYIILIDDKSYERRQDTPNSFDLSTVAYVSTPKFILNNNRIWEGNVATVIVPPERAIDIDNQIDLDFARFLSTRKI